MPITSGAIRPTSQRGIGEPNPTKGDAFYEEFYQTGGWKYSFWKEFWWHRKHLVKRFGLRRGMRILDVACGAGFHTNLLNRMGFDCIGIDRSKAGIEWALAHYPRSTYCCCDIENELPVEKDSFDLVFSRGCSHYHYDLSTEQAHSTTAILMEYLKPSGVFVLVVVTNLSGRRPPDAVWHNTLEDYRRHFASFGSKFTVDWVDGMAVCGVWRTA
jgi:SAM-dependent methyltransferase